MDPRNAWGAGGAEEDEMGIDRNRDFDVSVSERIVAGEDVGPRNLVNLLAIAAAPAHGDETAGEEAAVMAFRAARRRLAERGNRKPAVVRWAALLGAKTAAALAVAVVATGAALAAGTGVLPNPFRKLDTPPTVPASVTSPVGETTPDPVRTPPVVPSQPSGPPASVPPSVAPLISLPPTGAPANGGAPPPTVPASMTGLCRAYQAHEDRQPGSAANSPAFASLVVAAGGADQVPAYCAAVLGEQLTTESAQGSLQDAGSVPDAGEPGSDGTAVDGTGADTAAPGQ